MMEILTKYDNLLYAVHVKSQDPNTPDQHAGDIGLRGQATGPVLPPPPPASSNETDLNKPVNLRVIGYSFFQAARGKGYATEANLALIAAYKKYRAQFPEELSYIEAGVDKDNPESIRVLKKLGFVQVGWKEETEPIFLGGKWRGPGYWIYGLYI